MKSGAVNAVVLSRVARAVKPYDNLEEENALVKSGTSRSTSFAFLFCKVAVGHVQFFFFYRLLYFQK